MGDILGVHGIWQHRKTTQKLSEAWTAGLAAGWPDGAGTAPGVVVPHLSPLLRPSTGRLGADDEPTDDELELIVAAALEYLGDPDDDELAALVAEGRTLGIPKVPTPLQRIVQALDGRLGREHGERIIALVREVAAYLNHDQVRDQVRDALLTAHPDPGLVIGHSLGSVIAYDLAVHGVPFPALVTMGSPLGLRTVREHRTLTTDAGPAPATWTNVHDRHDPITAGVGLRPFWPHVDDVRVSSTKLSDSHGAQQYLSSPETGKVVAALL
ncbi:MAG: lipase family protein [Micrococcales bacterium]|nr:lipase family protein [Micrococcales bacterium]